MTFDVYSPRSRPALRPAENPFTTGKRRDCSSAHHFNPRLPSILTISRQRPCLCEWLMIALQNNVGTPQGASSSPVHAYTERTKDGELFLEKLGCLKVESFDAASEFNSGNTHRVGVKQPVHDITRR
ncbi:MAG: hypothetical protein MUO63_05870 [Desulfobulbaceae bacterium]|nr:hypothetical protein [Desulfobulbaceae bacterium]